MVVLTEIIMTAFNSTITTVLLLLQVISIAMLVGFSIAWSIDWCSRFFGDKTSDEPAAKVSQPAKAFRAKLTVPAANRKPWGW